MQQNDNKGLEDKNKRQQMYEWIEKQSTQVMKSGALLQSFLDVHYKTNTSVGNTMLLLEQMPAAREIGDFHYWSSKNARILKNSKSFKVFVANSEYKDKTGKLQTSYKIQNFFDISQTHCEGKCIPTPPIPIRSLLKNLMETCSVGFAVDKENQLPCTLEAKYVPEKHTILIQRGISNEELFRAISTEIAHVELDKHEPNYTRAEKSVDAECISYLLCKRNNIDAAHHIFDVAPQLLKNTDVADFKKHLGGITHLAKRIDYKLQKNLSKEDLLPSANLNGKNKREVAER